MVPSIAYTLTFWGTRTSDGLALKGELLAATGESALVTALDDTPLDGTHFGYCVDAEMPTFTNIGINAKFDDFLATVPEPSASVLLLAGLSLLRECRRHPSSDPC
jgi:hypothetical protein